MKAPVGETLGDRQGYALAVVVTAVCTSLNAVLLTHIGLTNLAMVYVLGVAYVASRTSPRASLLASVLGVAAFDFCFVPPSGTFAVEDVEYIVTFAVMLVVSLSISTLTTKLRDQSRARHQATVHAQVEKIRSDLLSGVSHDLRTPLASIGGSAEALLAQPELSLQSRQLASTIHEESGRMANRIRNLLDMTRFQGAIELVLDWHALDELAAAAILRTDSLFDHPVEMSVSTRVPPVQVDGILIEQVFVNLLENAARHAGRGARVRIRIALGGPGVTASIEDDGPGVPPHLADRVFERFEGSGGAGTGLGLAICRAAVEAHRGSIRLEPGGGRGATFRIELPVGQEAANG